MKHYLFALAIVLTAGLTILSGILHGRMANRWGPSSQTIAAAEKLEQLPTQFGDWRMKKSEKLSETTLNMLECAGYVARTYENRKTGEVVELTLLLGPSGPTAVHTPEICMGSQNYESRSERQPVAIRGADAAEDKLWALDFNINNLRGDVLRMYYGWSVGGPWSAPADARFTFVGQPRLYKIQLSSYAASTTIGSPRDPCLKFLQDFLPVVRSHLVPPSNE